MTERRHDARDEQARKIQHLIDLAIERHQAGEEGRLEHTSAGLFPAGLHVNPLPEWPKPTDAANALALRTIGQAAQLARASASRLGPKAIYTGSAKQPEVPLTNPGAPDPAKTSPASPLTSLCAPEAMYEPMVLIAYAHRKSKLPLAPEHHLAMLQRINRLVEIESNLWWLAHQAGLDEPVPYAVRYAAARTLWSPQTPGTLFCLRCGDTIHYRRAPRSGIPRFGRCRPCARGRTDTWPTHAIAPRTRSDWWLRCQRPGCNREFIGRQQARLCPRHRTARITPAMRPAPCP